jgi:cold shock protein
MAKTGVVKFFKDSGPWGFLCPTEAGPDFFVHAADVVDGVKLTTGDRVEFDPAEGKKGPVAKRVRLIDG